MGQPTPSVILLEFNELSPTLMDRFIHAGELPAFRKLRAESHCYVTDADGRPPFLNPWVQWPTVHTGVPYTEHGLTRLDEGHKLRQKNVWDLLSAAGFRVWICGTMNTNYDPTLDGAVLPDPWASHIEPHPSSLAPFYTFVKKNIQEHTNDDAGISLKEAAAFAAFLVGHGLSRSTVKAVVRQIVAERTHRAGRWRRVALLDRLQFDVFRSYYRRLEPNFSIFFSNSTAYLQHKHWRNLDPGPFAVKPTAEEQARFADAVLFGYKQMDALISEFMRLAGDGATLVFSTALSQQPCLAYEDQGGKSFYRPRDFQAFLTFAGVPRYVEIAPVMSEKFYVRFDDEIAAGEAERMLKKLEAGGEPLMFVDRQGTEVYCGCQLYSTVPQDARIRMHDSLRTAPFYELLYRAEGLKSGMHHSDGILWIRYPNKEHCVHDEKVPLTAVAPTLLDLFSVRIPAYMQAESLLWAESPRAVAHG